MDYNKILRCSCSLKLQAGRLVTLNKFIQSRTYAGLMAGLPDRESNDRRIEWLLRNARTDPKNLGEPVLIPPPRRAFQYEPGDMQRHIDDQRDMPEDFRRIPEWLPTIACIGFFDSHQPARDKTQHASSLTIAWFQEDYGLDPQLSAQLQAVDWERYATDWEY